MLNVFLIIFLFGVWAEENLVDEKHSQIQIKSDYLPFRVMLRVAVPGSYSYCRGIIVGKVNILTTANCLDLQKNFTFIPLHLARMENKDHKFLLTRRLSYLTVHEKYNLSVFSYYNLAVIKIKKKFRWNDYVQSANLTTEDFFDLKENVPHGDIYLDKGRCMTRRTENKNTSWPTDMEGDPLVDKFNNVVCLFTNYPNFSTTESVVGVFLKPHLNWIREAQTLLDEASVVSLFEVIVVATIAIFMLFIMLSIVVNTYYI